jgi:hypothetical protein
LIEAEYTHKGHNLTTLILAKAEHVARLLAEREGLEFEDAFGVFLASHTYQVLTRPSTLLWSESAEYVLDDYLREKSRTVV